MSSASPTLTPLRVLIVEDDPADEALVRRALRRSGFEPIGPRVDSEPDLLDRLDSSLDVILSDYALPSFDAFTTLRHVRERGVDAPVIIVSGTIGEEIAVETIRHGAVDYLLKDRLGRLGESVRQAVTQRRLRSEQQLMTEALQASETRLRLATSAAGMGAWELDLRTGEVVGSETMAAYLGLPPGTTRFPITVGQALVHPDDRAILAEADRRAIEDDHPYAVEVRLVSADGGVRWLAEKGEVVERDAAGIAVRMAGVTWDVTEQKTAEAALRRSERQLAEAQRIARIGSWEWEIATDDLSWSVELRRIFGLTLDPAPFSYQGFLERVHPDDRTRVEAIVQAACVEGQPFRFDYRIRLADGVERVVETRGDVVVDDAGRAIRMQGTAQDITERTALEAQLRRQAFHDALTGLPNRALLSDRLGQALVHASRRGTRIAALFVDIDNFKVVNDSLGHNAGDELLVGISRQLRLALREGDTVARFGGDEFVCILEDLAAIEAADAAARAAARVIDRLRDPVWIEGHEVVTTASIGVAISDGPAEAADDLLRHADQAMYVAKRAGKGRVIFFEPDMNHRAWTRLALERDLRRALEASEFQLVYQPIVELANGRVCAVEALLRWTDPARGVISPAEFVPVAEETGLIVPLGEWVIKEACRHAAAWQEGAREIGVAVNLSARQVGHPNLAAEVAEALAESGLPPRLLTLEITERVALANDDETTATLLALKRLGVHLAIDDFGTGYSGMSMLKASPVDELKVDQAFVAGLGVDERDLAIVRAVLALANALDLRTTAEGVETEEQATLLRRLGCRHAQGHLFARPMSAEAMSAFLPERRRLAAPAAAH
jgi:diguanylate cyclase (GGDEF)-like protein/PAS domain S-box-containing protein